MDDAAGGAVGQAQPEVLEREVLVGPAEDARERARQRRRTRAHPGRVRHPRGHGVEQRGAHRRNDRDHRPVLVQPQRRPGEPLAPAGVVDQRAVVLEPGAVARARSSPLVEPPPADEPLGHHAPVPRRGDGRRRSQGRAARRPRRPEQRRDCHEGGARAAHQKRPAQIAPVRPRAGAHRSMALDGDGARRGAVSHSATPAPPSTAAPR